ncbi:DUF1493 family protein [Paraburkholderia sp. Ac-20336]|uniref:DUF1493 family protein n=1 Tax=Burkholderiaceae TaxID=119060 RepID=UPI0014240AC9|nr:MULTISPECIES: DUF1493 family protein [Burkholderiaceae]MBN3804750.1 DUF1493 family protein [Paraburkholderia sp. Ac-20336]NIF53257.1 DUF1493 family protein [Burkholderia sp. Ax-1724]NIF76821.1 DUF1493 family protein [Paraburkholderia sp. Cy-641]
MTRQREASVELEQFFHKEVGIPDGKKIFSSSVIEDDFGITGDDANQLMEDFFEQFHVARGDYDFHRYFEIEASGFPIPFLDRWIRKKILGDRLYEKQTLTIAMLQHAIELGVWDSQRLRERESQRKSSD